MNGIEYALPRDMTEEEIEEMSETGEVDFMWGDIVNNVAVGQDFDDLGEQIQAHVNQVLNGLPHTSAYVTLDEGRAAGQPKIE